MHSLADTVECRRNLCWHLAGEGLLGLVPHFKLEVSRAETAEEYAKLAPPLSLVHRSRPQRLPVPSRPCGLRPSDIRPGGVDFGMWVDRCGFFHTSEGPSVESERAAASNLSH